MSTNAPQAVPSASDNLGFLLAKASQRFNERLVVGLAQRGFPEVRASFGSVLVPLFERDGLRVGEIAGRARLSKQSMTRLVRDAESAGLVRRRRDADDGRAFRVELTARGIRLRSASAELLAGLDDEVLAALGRRRSDALKTALKGVMDL